MTTKKQDPKEMKDLPAEEKAKDIRGGSGDPHLPTAITPTIGGIINPATRTGFPK